MAMPNFLVIGAGKAGTTSIDLYLQEHPQVYMSPVKEPNFFALEGEKINFQGPKAENLINSWSVNDWEKYLELFKGVKDEKAIGETSPLYLYSPKAPERIRHYIPNVKLIVILRNPVERAFSAYVYLLGEGRESFKDFAQALSQEEKRINANWEWIWHYQNLGFYYTQLQRYFDIFDRNQIRVYLFEELNNNPVGLLQDIFQFIAVDDRFVPNTSMKAKVSRVTKNRFLQNFLEKPNLIKDILRLVIPANIRKPMAAKTYRKNISEPPKLSPEIRKQLIQVYWEDILQLQDLIQLDLSKWLA